MKFHCHLCVLCEEGRTILCSPKISLLQYSCSITVSVACLHRLKSKESQLTVELRLVRKSSSRSSSPENRNGGNIECIGRRIETNDIYYSICLTVLVWEKMLPLMKEVTDNVSVKKGKKRLQVWVSNEDDVNKFAIIPLQTP